MKEVVLSREAQKRLDRLNEPLLGRILEGLEGLAFDPPKGDVKPLVGCHDGAKRLRVGAYRVLFFDDGNRRAVFKISPRGGVYRGTNERHHVERRDSRIDR